MTNGTEATAAEAEAVVAAVIGEIDGMTIQINVIEGMTIDEVEAEAIVTTKITVTNVVVINTAVVVVVRSVTKTTIQAAEV